MDTAIITASAKDLPQLNRIRNADDIETYLDRLYEALNHLTNTAVSLAKPKGHAAHWWNEKINTKISALKEAGKRLSKNPTNRTLEEDWIKKKKERDVCVTQAKRKRFRENIHQANKDLKDI